MKKLLFALFVILALSGMAFADPPGSATATIDMTNSGAGGSILSPSATATGGTGGTGGAGGSATATIEKGAIDNKNTNTNLNTNLNSNTNKMDNKNTNTNIQGQQQGQMQGQSQSTKNSNNAKQTVLFESPTPLLIAPSQNVPELNFGNGRMIDATKSLPNFAIYGIKKLGDEAIREVLNVNANVKFKNLYKAILDDAKGVANGGKKTLSDVRYQVIRAEGQKSWTTGGNLGGAGSALSTTGLSGASGAGSIIPQWGGTKADDLFTIIFVKVIL
ncbi:MAG: hypothetical protein O8C67_08860 [Candidatus Methanoperedens sp.]|nr:hypothetical protein [Candidatus Methanoperedens sp.]